MGALATLAASVYADRTVSESDPRWAFAPEKEPDKSEIRALFAAVEQAFPVLTTPTVNAGLAGAKVRKGYQGGHIRVGDQDTDPIDAFVGIYADEWYTNPGQEMRGLSYTIRNTRTTPDEATLGWDAIPVLGASVVTQYNTQFIRGNMKAVVGEIIAQNPNSGSYHVYNSYNLQATTIIGANAVLDNWYGLVIGTPIQEGNYDSPSPVLSSQIGNGYGIRIGQMVGTTSAAIKLDGVGDGGRVVWTHVHVTEDASGRMELNLNYERLKMVNPALSTTATGEGTDAVFKPTYYLKLRLPDGIDYGVPLIKI